MRSSQLPPSENMLTDLSPDELLLPRNCLPSLQRDRTMTLRRVSMKCKMRTISRGCFDSASDTPPRA